MWSLVLLLQKFSMKRVNTFDRKYWTPYTSFKFRFESLIAIKPIGALLKGQPDSCVESISLSLADEHCAIGSIRRHKVLSRTKKCNTCRRSIAIGIEFFYLNKQQAPALTFALTSFYWTSAIQLRSFECHKTDASGKPSNVRTLKQVDTIGQALTSRL